MEAAQKKIALRPDLHLGKPDLEVVVSSVLMAGVVLSMLLIFSSLLWHYVVDGTFIANYGLPKANFFTFSVDVFRTLFTHGLTPDVGISMGIVVLMFTPYIRIFASVIYFAAIEKNVKYALFSLFVLSALSYSLFLR